MPEMNGQQKKVTVMQELETLSHPAPPKPPLPSEVLFMFLGWLTMREESIEFGRFHDASKAVELIDVFCKENNLDPPREGWEKNLFCPPDDSGI